MAMLTVSTVVASDVPAGKLQIVANTRATKGKVIAENDRSRSVIIPEFAPQVADKYISLVSSALTSLATEQLRVLWKESDPKEVDSELFEENSLLAFAQREAESQRLTKESITDWWNGSQFKLFCVKKFGDKRAGAILGRLHNLAAPTPNYTEDQALQAIALFGAVELEEDDDFAPRIISKLQSIVDRIRKQRVELEADTAAPF